MKQIIGRADKADFPEFSLLDIDIKIDSGAYTSSIHCSNINEVTQDESSILHFTVLDSEHKLFTKKEFKTNSYTSKIVKSSNGISEKRFMIETKITIFNKTYPIFLTLTERKDMKFPILIGRKFLNKKFLIDTSKKNLSYNLKNKNK